MSDNIPPEHARVVLVPVANPKTAESLLRLAQSFVDPEEGEVLALVISVGAAENAAQTRADVQNTIEDIVENDPTISLITRMANSITRGILDTIREVKADLLILGAHRNDDGRGYTLGTIVENVAATADCDVLIYRAEHEMDFSRVIIAADGSPQSQVACHTGLQLARSKENAQIHAVYVQDYTRPEWVGLSLIEKTLEAITEQRPIKRKVVKAGYFVDGLMRYTRQNDLLLVGISEENRRSEWFAGDIPHDILNGAPGPVILAMRSTRQTEPTTFAGKIYRYFRNITPALSDIEQDEMAWHAHRLASPNLDYLVLIIISAALATFGLLLNNGAVIIGAMLVAPLMQPLVALAIGLATFNLQLIKRGVNAMVIGMGAALVLSLIIGATISFNAPTDEMLARSFPRWMDVGVALASGFIGAYATARKDIPSALAGVAIAAALMPPLCTVGLQFTLGNMQEGMESGMLFLMNITGITVTAWVVFVWFGMRPHDSPFIDSTSATQKKMGRSS